MLLQEDRHKEPWQRVCVWMITQGKTMAKRALTGRPLFVPALVVKYGKQWGRAKCQPAAGTTLSSHNNFPGQETA